MNRPLLAALAAGAIALAAGDVIAKDDLVIARNAAQQFAVLPDGVRYPEGIAANPATGDIFVATFDFGPNANKLMRFAKNGKLSAIRDMGGTPMLGTLATSSTGVDAVKLAAIRCTFDAPMFRM